MIIFNGYFVKIQHIQLNFDFLLNIYLTNIFFSFTENYREVQLRNQSIMSFK